MRWKALGRPAKRLVVKITTSSAAAHRPRPSVRVTCCGQTLRNTIRYAKSMIGRADDADHLPLCGCAILPAKRTVEVCFGNCSAEYLMVDDRHGRYTEQPQLAEAGRERTVRCGTDGAGRRTFVVERWAEPSNLA